MSQITDFYFPSSSGSCQIHARQWLPDEGPYVGIVQLLHGMTEHIERYDAFAQFLNSHGYIVVGNDHLGHGTSVASKADLGYFAEHDGWTHVSNDTRTLQIMTARLYPNLPYFLFGHSMGSFLTRTYLIRFPGTVDGAVLCGTGYMGTGLIHAAKVAAHAEKLRIGIRGKSKLLMSMSIGSYNKQFQPVRTGNDWLSVNRENVDAYNADPLCGFDTTVGFFSDLADGLALIHSPKKLAQMKKETPVFFIAGGLDPVGNNGDGVRKVYEIFKNTGMTDVDIRIYPGLRHEILNEVCHDLIYQDVLTWLESKRGTQQ